MTRAPIHLAAVALLLGACQSPPRDVANKCVPGWPAAAAPPAPLPALEDTGEPRILWRTRVSFSAPNDWILATAAHLAFTAGGRLFLLDRGGNVVGGRSSAALERVSTAVADEAGNYYFVGRSVYSVDASGEWRWIVPLPPTPGRPPGDDDVFAGRTAALAPDGTLYVGTSDGRVFAIRTADGSVRWEQKAGLDGDPRGPVVIGGIGGALLAVTRNPASDGVHRQLFDAHSGEALQSWPAPGGERYGVFFSPGLGVVTQRFDEVGGAYPRMDIAVLDACGGEKFRLPPAEGRAQWPALITPDERLLVVERDDVEHSPTQVSTWAADGTRVAGPTPAAIPWAIGADGTVYGIQCDSSGLDGPSRLVAYDAGFAERWRLELGASCPTAGPIIDADGRLYFTWFIDGVTELVAVQTASPGLATSGWPARRRDLRGSNWIP